MSQQPLHRVQWLTLAELAEMWAPIIGLPRSAVLRELRYGFYKLDRYVDMREPLENPPPEEDLPSPEMMVSREFVERFCTESEEWQLPRFWFDLKDAPAQRSFPGRPSVMNAILQELERIASEGPIAETLVEQARQLSDWAKKKFPGQQTPAQKATENGIRIAYNGFKRGLVRDH